MAYADYEDLMELTEVMLSELVLKINGSYIVKFNPDGPGTKRETEINFKPPFRRVKMLEYLEEKLQQNFPADKKSLSTLRFLERGAKVFKIDLCENFPNLPANDLTEKDEAKFVKKFNDFFESEAYNAFFDAQKAQYLETFQVPEELEDEAARQFFDNSCFIHKIQCSAPRSTARLIDKLVGEFIEVECRDPTFIMEHP